MDATTIRRIGESLDSFLRNVRIETDDGAAVWSSVCDPWQRNDIEAIAPAITKLVRGNQPEPALKRCWWERARGHSKTADYALLLLYILLFSPRRRRAVWAAADKDQGLQGLEACKAILDHNPWMASLLTVKADTIVNKNTGSIVTFITSDAPSAFGWLNVDLYILDELTHWKTQELWTALFSAIGKRRDCVLLIGMNAGWDSTWQYEMAQAVAGDNRWHVSALPGSVASWIDRDRLAEQERLLPQTAYDRLWSNRWQSGTGGDAFDKDDIDAAVRLSGPSERQPGWNYVGGADLAVRRDAAVVTIVGVNCGYMQRHENGRSKPAGWLTKVLIDMGERVPDPPDVTYKTIEGNGRLRLVQCQVWTPTRQRKISLGAVKDWIISAHQAYRLRCLALDPSQGERLAEELKEAGVPVVLRDQTGGALQEQSTTLLEALRERRLSLYDHPDLIADLKAARIVERSYGWRLEHIRATATGAAGTPHGDCTTALSIAVAVSKRYKRPPGPPRVNRPLVYS